MRRIGKRILWVILAIVLATLLLAVYTNVALGVSLRAKAIEVVMQLGGFKGRFATAEDVRQYMEQRAAANEAPLALPPMQSTVREATVQGFPVYYLNDELPKDRVILYLHGGAYVLQPNLLHWRFLDRLTQEAGMPIAVAIYPKAPAHQFAQAYAFVQAVYTDLFAQGYADVILMGDSAGGGLALGFAEWAKAQALPAPEKLVLLSPWLDLTMTNPEVPAYESVDPMLSASDLIEMGKAWAGDTDTRDYRLSPINGDLEGLPPTMLLVGTHEIFLPDARRFKALAEADGVILNYQEYPGMNHVFPVYPIPEAAEAMQSIVAFIEK